MFCSETESIRASVAEIETHLEVSNTITLLKKSTFIEYMNQNDTIYIHV